MLKLRRLQALPEEPAWVRHAFARAPFAVVRRVQARAGCVAIGLRGAVRSERYGTWAEAGDIDARFAPEDLADARPSSERNTYPVFAALNHIRQAQSLSEWIWGPTGSAGFELATGLPTITQASDLDLLIRAPAPVPPSAARALLSELSAHATRAGIRIDVQLDTPAGGLALAELASNPARVLVRGTTGPRLIADPWATDERRRVASASPP
jgi:phosphoribosyl-dephospho-CoA transferase